LIPALKTDKWEFTDNQKFLFEPHRYKVGKGGRNGTKSWGFGRGLLVKGFQQPLRILCAREIQKSIKESVHQLLKDQIELLGLGGFYEVLANEIRGANGTLFSFVGLSALTAYSIKSYEAYDICWVEEAALVTRRSWDILLPTIRKEDSEIWITFNPELDTDETWVRFVENTPEDCIVKDMSYDTNPWMTKTAEGERQTFLRAVKAGTRQQHEYDNIWLGHCRPAVEGAIYTNEVAKAIADGRLCAVPYDATHRVFLIWDLGWADSMAIGFVQVIGGAIRFIDYIEDNNRTYESYYLQITGIDQDGIPGKKSSNGTPYGNFGLAWLPHDGKNHNPQTGKTNILTLQELGLDTSNETIEQVGFVHGLRLARQMFPRCWFDKDKAGPLFNRLRRYAFKIGAENEEPQNVKKDINAHGSDMFRYTAVVEAELVDNDNIPKNLNSAYRHTYAG
jgi:phage terminase large subunit